MVLFLLLILLVSVLGKINDRPTDPTVGGMGFIPERLLTPFDDDDNDDDDRF